MNRILLALTLTLLALQSRAQKDPVEREIMVNTITQQVPTPGKIMVTGSSEMDVEPDQVDVHFVLSEYMSDKNNKVSMETIRKEFLKACADASIPKDSIRVEGLSGGAYQHYIHKKRKTDPGFMENVTFVIRLSNTKQIDALASRVNDKAVINMYVGRRWHTKMDVFRKEMRIKATQSALDKARYMSESIGEQIDGALLIEDVDMGMPLPMLRSNMEMSMVSSSDQGDSSMPFQKITIRSDVRAEFRLKRNEIKK
ncbi:MAG: SIMPL domain-containing protein [Bacteroidota bacterium]|jgi:uncharacterized protein YggE